MGRFVFDPLHRQFGSMDNIRSSYKFYGIAQDTPSQGPLHTPDPGDFGMGPSETHDYDHSYSLISYKREVESLEGTLYNPATYTGPSLQSVIMAGASARNAQSLQSSEFEATVTGRLLYLVCN